MTQYRAEIESVMEQSRQILRTIDDWKQQQQQQLTGSACSGCRQRDQRIRQLEDTISDLRRTNLNSLGQQLASTHISERQQQVIDLKILELMNEKQRAEEKCNAAAQELEAFKAQLKVYEDDFNAERQDRARARGELAIVASERDQYLKQLKECVKELSRYRQMNCSRQFNQAEPFRTGFPYRTVGIDVTDTPDAAELEDSSVSSFCRESTSPASTPPHVRSTNSSPVGGGDFTDDFRLIARGHNALDSEKHDSFRAGVTNRRSGSPSYVGSSSCDSTSQIDLMSFSSINNSFPARSNNR